MKYEIFYFEIFDPNWLCRTNISISKSGDWFLFSFPLSSFVAYISRLIVNFINACNVQSQQIITKAFINFFFASIIQEKAEQVQNYYLTLEVLYYVQWPKYNSVLLLPIITKLSIAESIGKSNWNGGR